MPPISSLKTALLALAFCSVTHAAERPKVRAITAFIDIDARSYTQQFEMTVKFLNSARENFVKAGFEVETIRIATQPFPGYTHGLSPNVALALLRDIDRISEKLQFSPAVGPAMLLDSDDTAPIDLLIDLLSTPSRVNASLVTAAEDGIHWKAVQQAARLIKAVGERSPHGQGNFNFAAISMLQPNGPFFPGAYHLKSGHSFSSVSKAPTW